MLLQPIGFYMWRFICLVSVLVFFNSCVTKKKLTYLRKNTLPTVSAPKQAYTIRPGDNLFIQIKSPDPSSSSFYNMNEENHIGSFNDAYIKINSYSVNPNGTVKLPFLGDIQVAERTVSEITGLLEIALTEHLKDANVFVKLVSYDITVLGEVSQPGKYLVYENDRINIFQALGLAGDITHYGKRKSVKVLRELSNGVTKAIEIDLSSNLAINSEGYYINPHDVIYVEPISMRAVEMNLKPIATVLSGAVLIVLILRLFQ